ncbi:hypothetical protein CCMSSC00406_0001049 [Pleurotus cornucopiae]|uniref:Uncharacterized protein n=1 Tax=Pleurotus cornucopiae TaxID=5321 RepID=A0ACB7IKU3_PLECO|nr:hypothetical protein CCMSSC00406_0001049 [Pleurotus cornucopiae]
MLNISTQFCLGTTDLTPSVLKGVSYNMVDIVDVYDLGRDVLGDMASVEEECGRQRRAPRKIRQFHKGFEVELAEDVSDELDGQRFKGFAHGGVQQRRVKPTYRGYGTQ